jgi:hypothetical protein
MMPSLATIHKKYNDNESDPEILEDRLRKEISKRDRLLMIALEAKNELENSKKIKIK